MNAKQREIKYCQELVYLYNSVKGQGIQERERRSQELNESDVTHFLITLFVTLKDKIEIKISLALMFSVSFSCLRFYITPTSDMVNQHPLTLSHAVKPYGTSAVSSPKQRERRMKRQQSSRLYYRHFTLNTYSISMYSKKKLNELYVKDTK